MRNYLPQQTDALNSTVKTRIDEYIVAQNRRHKTALMSDPCEIEVWLKQRGSVRCSCSRSEKANIEKEQQLIESTDDNLIPQPVNLRAKPNSKPNWSDFANQIDKVITAKKEKSIEVYDIDNDINPIEGQVDTVYDTTNDGRPQSIDTEIDKPDGEAMWGVDFERDLLYNSDSSRCGICLSSGYENSWQLHNGLRLLCTKNNVTDWKNYENTPDSYPPLFVGRGDAWIEWQVLLPKYWEQVLWIRSCNNLLPTNGIRLQLYHESQWKYLDEGLLNTLNGQGGLQRIRAITTELDNFEYPLTHVEIVLRLGEKTYGQMPHITLDDSSYGTNIVQSSMELQATVMNLTNGCIICESRNRGAWKVLSAESQQTGDRQIFNNTVQLRLVQDFEQFYLLNRYAQLGLEVPYQGQQKFQKLTGNT